MQVALGRMWVSGSTSGTSRLTAPEGLAMLTRLYNAVVHTLDVPTPGERLRELMTAANHSEQSLAKAINASERSVRSWLSKTWEDNPPRSREHREALARELGEDIWDTREVPVVADEPVDLTKLSFLDATALQHAERLAKLLADQARHQRPRHDQSNVVPTEWAWEEVKEADRSTTRPAAPIDPNIERSLFGSDPERADTSQDADDSSA